MVKIRLRRLGSKNHPFYRIVVADSRRARDGAYIELLGYYNPRVKDQYTLDTDRLTYWLGKGAQMTNRVKSIVKLLGAQSEQSNKTMEVKDERTT